MKYNCPLCGSLVSILYPVSKQWICSECKKNRCSYTFYFDVTTHPLTEKGAENAKTDI